tara:strand:+ start:267 stop:485 length:219 start_codon:yes stop_codon:yes gene_type:complete
MNRRRRINDVKISITPMWLDKVLSVLKWSLVVMPLLCVSVAMYLEPSWLAQSYVITAVWCLSLLKLVDVIND